MQNKMAGYTELLTKFNALKEKECAIMTQTGGKKEKKESLLRLKEKKTLTKTEQLELEHINTEEDIEARYVKNIVVIQTRRDKEENEVEEEYKATVTRAKRKYEAILEQAEEDRKKGKKDAELHFETTKQVYDNEKSASLNKENKTYSKKKVSLELQQEAIEDERNISIKTAIEITIEKDKRDLLTQMKSIIDILQLSRNQAPLVDREKLPAIPVLPETIVSQYVPVQPPPIQSVSTEEYEYDPKTSILREEFRMKRRELERAERERTQESARKPTVYGFVHELEGRPYVKPCYNPPIITDYEEVNTQTCDIFTKK